MEILSSAANVNVKVPVSFFLCESGGSAATQAIHKEKFNVPIDASHKDLHNFTKHVAVFTDLKQTAATKGLGQNPEVTIAWVEKSQIGGVDVFSIRTQDACKHEFPDLWTGNGMLQGMCRYPSDIFRLFRLFTCKIYSGFCHPVNLLLYRQRVMASNLVKSQ